jgi:hypothetical protein
MRWIAGKTKNKRRWLWQRVYGRQGKVHAIGSCNNVIHEDLLIKIYPPSLWRGVLGKKIHLINSLLLGEEGKPIIIHDAD